MPKKKRQRLDGAGDKIRQRKYRANRSEEEKLRIREYNKNRQALRRKNETAEETELRLSKQRFDAAKRRKCENTEAVKSRLAINRLRVAIKRSNETAEETELRRSKQREQAVKRRLAKAEHRQKHQHQEYFAFQKEMVMSLRMSELQQLLCMANKRQTGTKKELIMRMLNFIKKGLPVQVQEKIEEFYEKGSQRLSVRLTSDHPLNHKKQANATKVASSEISLNFSEQMNCSYSSDESIQSHPREVQLKQLLFYDVVADVMMPVRLISRPNAEQQECQMCFHLTDSHIKEVFDWRKETICGQTEFTVQVHLRFCLIDNSCVESDCFPSGVCVKVNGIEAMLPEPISRSELDAELRRPNGPVDITQLCTLSSVTINYLTVSWNVEENKSHCVCITLVRKLTPQILLQKLSENGFYKPESTKALIKEKLLSLDRDSEVATSSLRVSFLCPLGKMRMTLPCRATSCSHLQCFDALTFLQMNEKKPTWMCPVCDRPADFNKLVIDGLFVEILKEISDVSEVEFLNDEIWNVIRTKEFDENNGIPTPTSSVCVIKAKDFGNNKRAPTPISIVVDVHCVKEEAKDEVESKAVRILSLNTLGEHRDDSDSSLTE